MTVILALRGATAVVVLTLLVGGIPRAISVALAVTLGLWTALIVAPVSLGLSAIATATSDPGSLTDTALGLHLEGAWLVVAAREIVIGATLGVMAALPLLAATTAGRLVDLAAGGRAHGPYGVLFGVLAAAVFVGIDGHVAIITAIVDSHRAAPVVGDTDLLSMIGALIPSAVRLAVPWLVTAAVVEIAVGAGVRVAGRAGAHMPAGAAVPASLVAVTASLVGALAIAMASVLRG